MTVTISALKLDYVKAGGEIVGFIRKTVKEAGAKGAVVGLSGGVDSAVVGALCVKALGKERVVTILMPSESTPKEDIEDATTLSESWGVRTFKSDISPIASRFFSAIDLDGDKVARGNSHARIRMTMSYYVANVLNLLVAGTGDRSEDLLGFFTKHGDGGVDFLPIAHLYKSQVRELAGHLGLPERVVTKPSSPRLWPGHLAADELPADYDTLDVVLYCLFDEKMSPARAAAESGVGRGIVDAVLKKYRESAHKRAYPPMVKPW
ncbi:MAG: NAD+ synthase [Nitrososphaerales archaeon]|nr:NAD+ synthase [Nitrososphaerales archaeon]